MKKNKTKTPINARTIDDIYAVLLNRLLKSQKKIQKGKETPLKPVNLSKLQESVESYIDNNISYNNNDERDLLQCILFEYFTGELIAEIKEYKEEVTDGR